MSILSRLKKRLAKDAKPEKAEGETLPTIPLFYVNFQADWNHRRGIKESLADALVNARRTHSKTSNAMREFICRVIDGRVEVSRNYRRTAFIDGDCGLSILIGHSDGVIITVDPSFVTGLECALLLYAAEVVGKANAEAKEAASLEKFKEAYLTKGET
ncbi:MAG: hypothetical protein GY776_00975 [Alteromonas sp.]|nr:hypothetical protein [Alteromonas sp.]